MANTIMWWFAPLWIVVTWVILYLVVQKTY